MNIKHLFFLFFFGTSFFINSQENDGSKKYLVTYLEKRIASAEQLKKFESYPKFIKDKLLKEVNIGEEKMLFFDEETSLYSMKENIKNIKSDGDKTQALTLTDYYKNLKNNFLVIEKNLGDRKVVIKDNLHPFKWNLIDETKSIGSFICKKATSLDSKGREITAWYTKAIKSPNGPHEYGGLPGLILELKTKYKSFELKEIENTNTESKIIFPSLENAITMEDFKKEFNPKNRIKKSIRYN